MHEYDDAVLNCFVENQLKLLPEKVADNIDEAEAFLEDIAMAPEVFEVGDGRYLIVES